MTTATSTVQELREAASTVDRIAGNGFVSASQLNAIADHRESLERAEAEREQLVTDIAKIIQNTKAGRGPGVYEWGRTCPRYQDWRREEARALLEKYDITPKS